MSSHVWRDHGGTLVQPAAAAEIPAAAPSLDQDPPTVTPIGERRDLPHPHTTAPVTCAWIVSSGDQDGMKGVISHQCRRLRDQYEGVATARHQRAFLIRAGSAVAGFPFVILGFHTDNGSEYINRMFAKLLNKCSSRSNQVALPAQHHNAQAGPRTGPSCASIWLQPHPAALCHTGQ